MHFFTYISKNIGDILLRTLEHIQLTLFSIGIAVLIGVPLGILISYIVQLKKPVLGFANVMQAVPSIALLGFLVPFLGIGEKPAVFMVVVYSLLPIIKNTVTGLAGINPQTLEAAKGIGMTRFQILAKIKLPLALPVIMAGIRISAVTSVGLVTLAAFIGAAGLGYLIYSGIRTVNTYQILAGAAPACMLALFVDFAAALVEKAVTPVCFKEIKKRRVQA
ncbi:MAG: ABC transporter permease [Treponema sp.]|jgi:osmoprotectant transport system permease protein|nr:ABC transporter permease [Treponema sp.]